MQKKIVNKSLVTNLIALMLAVGGYFSPWYRDQVLSTGIFALSGALTNWLAIYMLFEKVPFLYGSGVIPNHFEEFKSGIKNLIMNQFFTRENMNRYFSDNKAALFEHIDLNKAIEKIDYDKIFDSILIQIKESSFGGMIAMFGGGMLEGFREPFKAKVKDYINEELSNPDFLTSLLDSEDDSFTDTMIEKVEDIVLKRLDELTPKMVKDIIQEMIRTHLGWLVVWGGVFGGLIGLIFSFVKVL